MHECSAKLSPWARVRSESVLRQIAVLLTAQHVHFRTVLRCYQELGKLFLDDKCGSSTVSQKKYTFIAMILHKEGARSYGRHNFWVWPNGNHLWSRLLDCSCSRKLHTCKPRYIHHGHCMNLRWFVGCCSCREQNKPPSSGSSCVAPTRALGISAPPLATAKWLS